MSTLSIIGVGPGDPELVTLKAARTIAASRIIAYFAKANEFGNARRTAAALIAPGTEELRLEYPFTTEIPTDDARYRAGIDTFHAACAARVAARLDRGQDVAVLCEGDPSLYGSCRALIDRLGKYRLEMIAGVSGMSGCAAAARLPMTRDNDVLSVLPATLGSERLRAHLAVCDAAVIMKLGRNLANARAALAESERLDDAVYVERGTMDGQRIVPMARLTDASAPYFSLVLVPGRRRR